ncbi:MAG: hypothetical protein Ta2E_09040 [Mycoplasmoidaceae bacterium]|nr:MAG: hypothetical protein Ta2E_09040 [Mycoplasmoidaceae bacterium]
MKREIRREAIKRVDTVRKKTVNTVNKEKTKLRDILGRLLAVEKAIREAEDDEEKELIAKELEETQVKEQKRKISHDVIKEQDRKERIRMFEENQKTMLKDLEPQETTQKVENSLKLTTDNPIVRGNDHEEVHWNNKCFSTNFCSFFLAFSRKAKEKVVNHIFRLFYTLSQARNCYEFSVKNPQTISRSQLEISFGKITVIFGYSPNDFSENFKEFFHKVLFHNRNISFSPLCPFATIVLPIKMEPNLAYLCFQNIIKRSIEERWYVTLELNNFSINSSHEWFLSGKNTNSMEASK